MINNSPIVSQFSNLSGSTGMPMPSQVPGRAPLGRLVGANLNSTADQAIPMLVGKYLIRNIVVTNTSATPTLAVGGIYPAAAKAGTPIVAASQAYSGLSSALIALDLTLAVTATALTPATIYLSLTTGAGLASTADIFVYGDILA